MRRFNAARFAWEMQEHLHVITYRFLNLPPPGNRWYYPNVMAWDENERGDNLIPAFIIFYYNPSYLYPYDDRRALQRQLQQQIPEHWDCYWMFGQGFLFAEHREDGIPSFLPEEMKNQNRHAAHQYDEYIASLGEDYSRNGHKELPEDEDVVLLVPPYE